MDTAFRKMLLYVVFVNASSAMNIKKITGLLAFPSLGWKVFHSVKVKSNERKNFHTNKFLRHFHRLKI